MTLPSRTVCAGTAKSRLSKHPISGKRSSARIFAEWRGGTIIPNWCSAKRTTQLLALIAESSLKVTAMLTVGSAPVPVTLSFEERGSAMTDYEKRLIAYQTAMALARSMRSKGIISAKEYAKIDTIIAKKYGISSGSIFR